MIAVALLAISLVALVQFTVYSWRALMAGVAAEPLSDRVRAAAGLTRASIGAADFNTLLNLHDVTPGLKESSGGLWRLRAYYKAVELVGRLAGVKLPALGVWADSEMTLCARYVAVLTDRRLESNLACAADIRSC